MPGYKDNINMNSICLTPLAAIAEGWMKMHPQLQVTEAAIARSEMKMNSHLHVADASLPSGSHSHSHYDYMHDAGMIPPSHYKAMRAVANHTPEKLLDNNAHLLRYRNEIPQRIYELHKDPGCFFTNKDKLAMDAPLWNKALQFCYKHHIVWKAHREADLAVGAPSRTSSPVLYHGGVLSHCFAQTIMQSLLTPQQYAENEVYCDQAIQLAACTWNDVSQPAYHKAFLNGATTGGVTMVGLMMPARVMGYMPMKYKAMTFSLGFTYESLHQL